MSAVAVRHQVCRYFGGEYVPEARAYLTPQVPGLGVVKRSRGKRTNKRELHDGMDTEKHGTAMLVHIDGGQETRRALAGAANGIKLVRFDLHLHLFLHSSAGRAEDTQDAFVQLCDDLLAHIRRDRTLGSGGFEARLPDGRADPGGFQVGEGGEPGIQWQMDPVETRETITRGYLDITLPADQYIHA